jgi:16S rRNA (cytidine1402-2'-O)-methyltransferase
VAEKGVLYLIPTVLSEGQFQTIPQQVRDVIVQLDYFLVENVRTARRYVSGLSLGLVIENLEFEEVAKATDAERVRHLLKGVENGRNAGIISESGCPGVADPGAQVVSLAHELGIRVIPLVGPSSVLLALMASGMNGQSFTFHGYLPIARQERNKAIARLEQESARNNQTQIFIETPYRNDQMLAAILSQGRDDTLLCVARDVTGTQEFVETHPLIYWKKNTPRLHKVPVIFLLYRKG